MARIRTIKPGFWAHEDLSALAEATHMLAAALLNHADDEGYFNAHPGLVKSVCCPLREPSVSVHDSLSQLAKVGFIKLGKGSDGKRYGFIVTFLEHQRVNRPIESKIKKLGIVWDDSVITHPQITEDSPPEWNGKEGNRKGEKRADGASAFVPPDWIPADSWTGYIEMRKKQRKNPTIRAMQLVVQELAKLRERGNDPGRVLDASTKNGWTDVWPLKEGKELATLAAGEID